MQIALAQFLLQLAETGASRTLALQVVQEFLDGADKQSDPSEVAHVREDVHRIESLQRGIDSAQFGKLFGGNLEHRLVEIILCQQAAHVPQGLFRNVGALVRIVADAEGMMPFEVEGELSDCLLVGQVAGLLSKHQTQHCVKFFRRGPVLFRVERGDLLHGKLGKDLLAENRCPGLLQQLPASRTKMIQRVEHVERFVVFCANHDQLSASC